MRNFMVLQLLTQHIPLPPKDRYKYKILLSKFVEYFKSKNYADSQIFQGSGKEKLWILSTKLPYPEVVKIIVNFVSPAI